MLAHAEVRAEKLRLANLVNRRQAAGGGRDAIFSESVIAQNVSASDGGDERDCCEESGARGSREHRSQNDAGEMLESNTDLIPMLNILQSASFLGWT